MACLVALLFVVGTVSLIAAVFIGLTGAMVGCLIAGGCAALFLGLGVFTYIKVRWNISVGRMWIWAVVQVALLVFAMMTVSSVYAYRKDSRRSLCISNMRLIDHAKEVLAIRNGLTSGQAIADSPEGIWKELDTYIDGTNLLSCPEAPGWHYVYGAIDVSPKCPVLDKYREHIYEPD